MAKDAVATMGGLLPDDAGGRDAVHVAVFSAYSDEELYPHQKVAIVNEDEAQPQEGSLRGFAGKDARVSRLGNSVGLVDPFLPFAVIEPGKRFWVYLYPRTITALSHRWSHPAFEQNEESTEVYATPAAKLASEEWLRDFCKGADCPGYEFLVEVSNKIADGKTKEYETEDLVMDGHSYGPYDGWWYDDEYLGFVGQDAHAAIPPEFWTHMETVIGRRIFKGAKPTYFTCSC